MGSKDSPLYGIKLPAVTWVLASGFAAIPWYCTKKPVTSGTVAEVGRVAGMPEPGKDISYPEGRTIPTY